MTTTERDTDVVTVPEGANDPGGWHYGFRTIETLAHEVGGYKLRVLGVADQTTEGNLQDVLIQFQPWKHGSYFEESADVPELTSREARQLAYVLLALAEEVDGWV